MLEGVGHTSPGPCKAAKSGTNPVLPRNCDAPSGDERGRPLAPNERQPSEEGRFERHPPPDLLLR
jgi:hypothetical protein